jgi:hypothetical protein
VVLEVFSIIGVLATATVEQNARRKTLALTAMVKTPSKALGHGIKVGGGDWDTKRGIKKYKRASGASNKGD